MATESTVPSTRLGRLSLMGRLAGGIAGGLVTEGVKHLAQGRRPSLGDLVLTPANAQRLADRLSEMRGAAMKIGQLLSMDSGQLLPPQLSEVLARLRDDAHQMPLGQVGEVLTDAWGQGWESRFKRFVFTPIAAASIGQVHEATLRDGTRLAIKVQYPGIGRSIDSDVDNVASLLRLAKLIPEEIDFSALLDEAKRQLHVEADYRLEARSLDRYTQLVGDDDRFDLPDLVEALTTAETLAMTHLQGGPITMLAELPAPKRNAAAGALLELAIREVFEWGLVQTDPNFANYLYDPNRGRIQLLDFGATREYSARRRSDLRGLLLACLEGDDADVAHFASEVGYIERSDPERFRAYVVALLRTVTEPASGHGSYAFHQTDLAQRMKDILVEMRLKSRFGRLPPPDVLFLHRKLSGIYLLMARLQARIPVRDLIKTVVEPLTDLQTAETLGRA